MQKNVAPTPAKVAACHAKDDDDLGDPLDVDKLRVCLLMVDSLGVRVDRRTRKLRGTVFENMV